jgi:hypothetical protein
MVGMKLISILIIYLSYCNAFAEADLIKKIRQDESFIVPGLGAEKIILGDDISQVVQRFTQNSYKISKPKKMTELFKDVFGLSSRVPIYFDAVYHNGEKKFSLFVFQNRVIAILGMNVNKVTFDFVELTSGLNNFILNYGNKDLNRMRNESHGIYYYPSRGIAVVDDNFNDTIDLYIIFKTRWHNERQEH